MFRFHLTQNDQVIAFFVHNHENKAWLRAEKASYVHSEQTSTPMLSGFTAFESPEKAKIMATEVQGKVMTFDEVLAYYKANPILQGEHSMEHDH
jgi:nitrous oxide reductase accessory protein NosL